MRFSQEFLLGKPGHLAQTIPNLIFPSHCSNIRMQFSTTDRLRHRRCRYPLQGPKTNFWREEHMNQPFWRSAAQYGLVSLTVLISSLHGFGQQTLGSLNGTVV